jgi:hypothetical protein
MLVSNELEGLWTDGNVAQLKVLSLHYLEGLDESHEMSVRTAGHLAEISTRDLPNINQECIALATVGFLVRKRRY